MINLFSFSRYLKLICAGFLCFYFETLQNLRKYLFISSRYYFFFLSYSRLFFLGRNLLFEKYIESNHHRKIHHNLSFDMYFCYRVTVTVRFIYIDISTVTLTVYIYIYIYILKYHSLIISDMTKFFY